MSLVESYETQHRESCVCLFLNLHQKILFQLIFRESGRKRERKRNINHIIYTPTWDQTCHLAMCPDQESNLQPFGIWNDTSTSWATQPGLSVLFLSLRLCNCLLKSKYGTKGSLLKFHLGLDLQSGVHVVTSAHFTIPILVYMVPKILPLGDNLFSSLIC